MTQVSIIIVNYNTFELTCKCIESIIAETKKVSFEIILLDNASTDQDPTNFKVRFPDIQLLRTMTNIGFSKGNNLAIGSCKGEVVLLLNSDTELIEDSISECYQELKLNPVIGAITCKLIYPNGTVQNNCQSFPSFSKYLIEKTRLHKLLPESIRANYLQGFFWNYERSGYPDWVWGTFFMFKKDLLLKLPNEKLNEEYFMYVEDMQWCYDISRTGLKIKYKASTKVIHHVGGSAFKAADIISKNQQNFVKKNYSSLRGWIVNSFMKS